MWSSPGRCVGLLLLCAAIALPLRSEDTPATKKPAAGKTNGSADKKTVPGAMPPADVKAADGKPLDLSSLPADAVVVVCERAAEALNLIPNAVILSPKKYQELLDEITRLKKLLQTDKPTTPSTCHLKGKFENNAVLLQAQFDVVTDRPNAVVALACPQALATSARIDGQTPMIRAEADGFFIQVEKAGNHQVALDLVVPLMDRPGNSRGLELTLPHAASTTLELDMPSRIKDLRVGGKPWNDSPGLTLRDHHLGGGLGPGAVDRLELVWKEDRPSTGTLVLTAEGAIQVRIDSTGQTTEAELLLKVEGGQTNVWRLLVPLGSKVTTKDGRVTSIDTANQKFASLRTIHLKETGTEPLRVHVAVHAPSARAGTLAPVGPFFVVGADRQSGAIVVRNLGANLRLDYRPHGDMDRRPLTDEQRRDPTIMAAFAYRNIPLVDKPQGFTGEQSLSWLDLQTTTVRGQVRTRVTHLLTLRPDASRDSLRWDIKTTIVLASKWADVEQLKVFVPPGWTPLDDAESAVAEDKGTRFVTLKLSSPPRDGSGASPTLKLEGRYNALHRMEGRAVLKLPRPAGSVEHCEVTIQVPRDSEVFLHNADSADLELVKQSGPNEQTWHCRRVLSDWRGLELTWHPYRPELSVTSVVDLFLNGGRGDIRHEIRWQSPQTVPALIALRVPRAVGDSLRVEGGELKVTADDGGANARGILRLVLPAKPTGGECRLVLKYAIALGDKGQPPRSDEPFAVPLVTPEQATRGETKVRVWSEPGCLPLPVGGPPWEERNIEEVKDQPRLPILVLRAMRVDAPLMLRAGEQSPVFTVLVERAVVRVQVQDGGGQSYRASFQLRQLAARHLDIELPGPVPTLNLQVTLDRRKVTPDIIINESGQQTDGGSIARLRLGPNLVRQASLLELSYQLPPGRTAGSPLRTILQPPVLRGAPATVPTRWQITVPSNRVLIAPESATGLERTWVRRGWLLAARLQRTSADLEREFDESLPADLRRDGERLDSEARGAPALVCWQDTVEPLTLTHAPQQAWLFVCSLSLLILGLGLFWSARPQPGGAGHMAAWFWPIVALITLVVAAAILFWPTTLWAIVYGCEPGALVLLCVVGFQWLMHQRYRRQIVFLPSFSRGRAGSSLVRKSTAQRPQSAEPSTVDAPPPGSSAG